MSEAIYKVGDVLVFDGRGIVPIEFGNAKPPFNVLILRAVHPGPEFYIYTVVYEDTVTAAMKIVGVNQKDLLWSTKRIGHIDLDPFLDENWKEPEKKNCEGKGKNDLDEWMLATSVVMALGASKEASTLRLELDAVKMRVRRNLMQIGFTAKAIGEIIEGERDSNDGCCTDKC